MEIKIGILFSFINTELKTASKAVALQFISDKQSLSADGYEVAHLEVQLVDENGCEVKTENAEIEFSFEGDISWLGVDNGARDNIQDFQSKTITTAKGRSLAIIQSKRNKGTVKVTAKAEGFESKTININVK